MKGLSYCQRLQSLNTKFEGRKTVKSHIRELSAAGKAIASHAKSFN